MRVYVGGLGWCKVTGSLLPGSRRSFLGIFGATTREFDGPMSVQVTKGADVKQEDSKLNTWLGWRTKWLLGAFVATVAIVPSLWLAVLEQRANNRLVDEVDRALHSDAIAFSQQFSQIVEQMLYDQHLRHVLEREGYVVHDPEAPSGAFYEIESTFDESHPVEYPFLIDFADTTVFPGRTARHPDELVRTFARRFPAGSVSAENIFGRGYVEGPYGPFHYAYVLDSLGVGGSVVMRGVKVNVEAVQARILPAAFQQLRQVVRAQRGGDPFPGDIFGFVVQTPGTTIELSEPPSARRYSASAIGIYEHTLDLGGLFPNWEIEVSYLNELKARRWRSYLASIVPLLIVIVGVVVTARMAMREMELNQVKSLFVSNVSHELKTPLTKINLFNELLQGLPPDAGEKKQRYHDVIHQECERLTMLIDNVLDLNRIERGQMDYEFVEVPVEEVISEMAETFNVIYEPRGYGIDLHMSPDLPVMTIDPGAIKQALINLTDNAVKYSKEPHTLVVRAERTRMQGQPAVTISVRDQGVGIPRDKIKLIFEEFYRVNDGQTVKASGSGLGLALVRHIVTAHGGTITVDSKEGVGSTFTMSLPVRPPKKRERE